jgi:hypothetical protein
MRLSVALLSCALLVGACSSHHGSGTTGGSGTGKVGHVFVIILENESAAVTFGDNSPAPYLAHTLPAQGAFVPNYYGTGHLSNDNYISMVSGQAPNPLNQSDCQVFLDFNVVGATVLGPDGQAVGQGCVFPTDVLTVGDQLQAAKLSWKGYMEDMGNDPVRDNGVTCGHPKLNSQDGTQTAAALDNYATRHNPFVYFHSIIDDQANCDAHVVPLSRLDADISSLASTPNYVFITPSLCHDGHDAPCADATEPGGLKSADAFLQAWVPRILNSPAFQKDGLLIITFDEAEIDTTNPVASDASYCCGELPGPNSPLPGIYGLGGGRVGAVLLSPFIKAGTVTQTPYNHYAMLRSVEDIFGLDPLGYAATATPFGADVYTNH